MKKKLLKKVINQRVLFWFVFASFVLSIAYIIVRIVIAPEVVPEDNYGHGMQTKSDYSLTLVMSIFGTLLLFFPSFVAKKFKIVIPSGMIVAYVIFLYCGIFLGEMASFYYNFPHWDKILHISSGFMLGALGFTLISFLNKTNKIPVNLSPFFVATFSFCFALAMGALWEIFEFTVDSALGTNMQKFMLEDGTPLVGQEALNDTMWDFIIDAIGALAFSFFGYFTLIRKKESKFLNGLVFEKQDTAKN